MKAAALAIPEEVLLQHVVIFGKTGAGKSSVLRHMVEHLISRGKRVCIIDPKGDWWGLPSSADGMGAGFPVVLFGDFKSERSDVPMDARAGKEVAQIISGSNQACVLGFRGWMPGDLTKFWLDFAPTLFNSNKGELYLVIDEVHNFAPKGKIMSPESGKMLHWTNRLASEGRGLGLKLLLASQRPQKVHNDTSSCCETMIAMRVTHPRDRAAIREWIDECGDAAQGKPLLADVTEMKRGQGWVWFPDGKFMEKVQFPMFRSFDSFSERATHAPKTWAVVDVEAVRAKLARVVQEKEANDPAKLRSTIEILKARFNTIAESVGMRKSEAWIAPELNALVSQLHLRIRPEEEPIEVPMLSSYEFAQLCDIRRNLEKVVELSPLLEKLTTIKLKTLAGKTRLEIPPRPNRGIHPWIGRKPPAEPPDRTEPYCLEEPKARRELTTMQHKLLTVLAENPAGLTKTQILIHADYRSSGPISMCFAQMSRDGWMQPGGQGFQITPLGRSIVGPITPLPKGYDLRQFLMAGTKLSTMEKALLNQAFEAYPNSITKGAILERAHYKSSGPVSMAFAKLTRINYLIAAGSSKVRAADVFFA